MRGILGGLRYLRLPFLPTTSTTRPQQDLSKRLAAGSSGRLSMNLISTGTGIAFWPNHGEDMGSLIGGAISRHRRREEQGLKRFHFSL
jgi:hypothetical protein